MNYEGKYYGHKFWTPQMCDFTSIHKNLYPWKLSHSQYINIIQLLTGDEGNIWYVGPEDKMLPEAEGRGQHFVWRSNIWYVARIPSQ